MTTQEEKQRGSGMVIAGMAFVVLLILKLSGIIQWSWVWVFAPIWIPGGFWVFVVMVLLAFT